MIIFINVLGGAFFNSARLGLSKHRKKMLNNIKKCFTLFDIVYNKFITSYIYYKMYAEKYQCTMVANFLCGATGERLELCKKISSKPPSVPPEATWSCCKWCVLVEQQSILAVVSQFSEIRLRISNRLVLHLPYKRGKPRQICVSRSEVDVY